MVLERSSRHDQSFMGNKLVVFAHADIYVCTCDRERHSDQGPGHHAMLSMPSEPAIGYPVGEELRRVRLHIHKWKAKRVLTNPRVLGTGKTN